MLWKHVFNVKFFVVMCCQMIDEFSDVNEGEKEVMKMWNLHVMHNRSVLV